MLRKRTLTKSEEFQIMHMVFDKFLLLSILVMLVGLVKIVFSTDILFGFFIICGGAILMIIFAFLLIREYEFIEHH
ncbi:MAG: hypothetical protein ACOCQQ_02070 [Candidatus Nanoarchaeia archaeon]